MKVDIINKTKYKINKTIIEKSVQAVIANLHENPDWQISVAIVTPDEIRELNKQYRNKDSVTDVLSFPMNENGVLGDIIICYERLLTQAADIGNTSDQELAFLTVHSMLHLFGYDHMTEVDEAKILAKQKEIISEMF